ncbi:glutamate--tRNA ligase [Pseudomonadota bacterium]
MIITRFAPSPTGFLHIGNVRTAIINYLYSKKRVGKVILRFDDTDIKRGKKEYADTILQDMVWLGLEYDEFYKQSKRLELYEKKKNELIASGKLYPCYETEEEIGLKRKMANSRGVPFIYDREALHLLPQQIKDYEAQGRKPHYRFLLDDKEIRWEDKIKGTVRFKERTFSDPVLIREDGSPLYTFCSVVDDVEMGITDIVRGEDHVTNTAVQIQIFEALGGKVPNFAHLTTIKTSSGKMSKRIGGFSIKDLREGGFEAQAVLNMLSQLGIGKIENYNDFQEILKDFDISNYAKAPANYIISDLEKLNEKFLHEANFKRIKTRLKEIGLEKIDEKFWNSVKRNLQKLEEIKDWWKICKEEIRYNNKYEDRDFLKDSASVLPNEKFTEKSWNKWIASIKDVTGRASKGLFMPLRLALTAQQHGPELQKLLPLINREEVIKRLLN